MGATEFASRVGHASRTTRLLCEHLFVTAEASPRTRFRRAIERQALCLAEDAMREMGAVTLQEAHDLLVLYAERGSPKYDKAAMRWLTRYLEESEPTLERFAKVVASLAARNPERSA